MQRAFLESHWLYDNSNSYIHSRLRGLLAPPHGVCQLGSSRKNDHSHHPLHAWCAICASTYSRPRGPTRAHEGSRGPTRAHEGPRGLTRAHEGSCKYCVGYAQYWSTDCTSDTSSSALTIRKSSTTLPMPTCHIKADGHSV